MKNLTTSDLRVVVNHLIQQNCSFNVQAKDNDNFLLTVPKCYEKQLQEVLLEIQPLATCPACLWEGTGYKPLAELGNLSVRLKPGDKVPAGECPTCRAFCYLTPTDT